MTDDGVGALVAAGCGKSLTSLHFSGDLCCMILFGVTMVEDVHASSLSIPSLQTRRAGGKSDRQRAA